MRFISLTNSRFSAIVNDNDYDRVMALNTDWCLVTTSRSRFICSTRHLYKNQPIKLGRFIMNLHNTCERIVDHKYGDPFDNRKENLREASYSENAMNRKNNPNKHGFIGIYFHTKNKNWVARVRRDRIVHNAGIFKTAEEAARARDKKALELFGEFAVLNFKQ